MAQDVRGAGAVNPEWATGKYGVMVYDGDRKVSQVEYEVVP
ncbi:MAG: hypothetical protein OXL37_04535 [Chloroflexota bacterium]|nr:hypothetical protein [Chloroflexota bacterium]MDE2960978.1 hypothetical protein [Chloroflexota bacterium]